MSGMGKEVYCSSSRVLYAQRAGAAHGSRTTRSWHQLPGNGSSVVYVRGAQYARECPARAYHRSVLVRTGRVYGCSVLARGQETIHIDAERVHRRVCAREDRELSPQIQSRGWQKRGLVRA